MAYPVVSAPYGLKPVNLIGGQVFAVSAVVAQPACAQLTSGQITAKPDSLSVPCPSPLPQLCAAQWPKVLVKRQGTLGLSHRLTCQRTGWFLYASIATC